MKKSTLCRVSAVLYILICILQACTVFAEAETEDAAQSSDASSVIATNSIRGWPQGPDIFSEAAIVEEAETGTVLYAKNIDEPLPPSSSVKIMTCLLALENSSLSDEVTITETGQSGVTDGGANISVEIDEVFTMEQCLYAIMLASANDISLQVAEHIGGSVNQFVGMMNERAAELGCMGTHFMNPTGLTEEGAVTTAHDLAIIIHEAMKNRTFRKIASTLYYTIPATNVSAGERTLANAFLMIDPGSECYYAPTIGGKEGYTEASGSVLACMAEQNDMDLICVVMKGAADNTVYEAAWILSYAFGNFKLLDLGADDFSVASGGIVCIPSNAEASDVEATNTPLNDGTQDRYYTFNDIPVGSAVAIPDEPENDLMAKNSVKNLEEAQDYKAGQATIAYVLIAAAGFAVLCVLLRILIRIIKTKSEP